MTIWTTPATSANTSGPGTGNRIARAVAIPFNVRGLNPNSRYFFRYNTNDMTWACKQPGQKIGANTGLLSSANGNLTFQFYTELNNNISGTTDVTKVHSFSLVDIAGDVKAMSQINQQLVLRTS